MPTLLTIGILLCRPNQSKRTYFQFVYWFFNNIENQLPFKAIYILA